MKRFKIMTLVSFLALILFYACKKDNTKLQGNPTTSNAYLKVMDAAPGFRQVFNSPDSFNILVGGQRIVYGLTYNSAFPVNTTNVNTYAAVPANAQDIRLVVRGIVNADSNTIVTIPKSLVAGSKYTLIVTDSISTTPDYSKIWAQDNFNTPDSGKYSIRCINAVMNDTAGKKIDVYSYRNAGNIFSNVSPGDVTAFSTLNIPSVFTDTFSIRRAGTTFQLAILNSVSITNNHRVYTLLYRGDGRLTSGTKARGIVVYTNQ